MVLIPGPLTQRGDSRLDFSFLTLPLPLAFALFSSFSLFSSEATDSEEVLAGHGQVTTLPRNY